MLPTMITKVILLSLFCSCSFAARCYDLSSHRNAALLPKVPNCGLVLYTNVMGGEDAQFGEFPWMVSLYTEEVPKWGLKNRICGGTLLTGRHVLTSAHCVSPFVNNLYRNNKRDRRTSKKLYNLYVRVGEYDISQGTKEVLVKGLLTHPLYHVETFSHDIALVYLNKIVLFNRQKNIFPICLPLTCDIMELDLSKKWLQLAGWGLLQEYPYRVEAGVLQKIRVQTIPNSQCNYAWRHSYVLEENQVCATGEMGTDQSACLGDSGDPLMLNENHATYVVGTVSVADKCAAHNPSEKPVVFTRVAPYTKWILDNLPKFNIRGNTKYFANAWLDRGYPFGRRDVWPDENFPYGYRWE